MIAGEIVQAVERLDRAQSLGYRGPVSAWRLRLALAEGDAETARQRYAEWLREDRRIHPEHRVLFESLAPMLDDPARIEQAREALLGAVARWPSADWTLPLSLFGLHDDAAAEALREKPASGDLLLMMVWAPAHRALREHPDFWTLAARDGLLAFWTEHGYPDSCRLADEPPMRLECSQ